MRNIKVIKPRKLAPKKRVEADWCSSGGERLQKLTEKSDKYYRIRRAKQPEIPDTQDSRFTVRSERFGHTFIRCPGCGRRLHPRMPDTQDGFDGFRIPSHKTK